MLAVHCPNFRLENCIFFRCRVKQLKIYNFSGESALVQNNIFTDCYPAYFNRETITLGYRDSLIARNNCYFVRTPQEKKVIYLLRSDADRARLRDIYAKGQVEADWRYPLRHSSTPVNFSQIEELIGETDSLLTTPEFAGDPEKGSEKFAFDRMSSRHFKPDFNSFFVTSPEEVKRGIGLIPEDFKDFKWQKDKSVEE